MPMDSFPTNAPHEYWMRQALKEAERAYEGGEVPVGAVVVYEGKVIGKGYNQIEQLRDPTAHAEIIAITAAAAALQSKWLENCTLYVTLEPCAMCAGAIVLARLTHLVIGARDPKTGACGSLFTITDDRRLNHRVTMTEGVLKEQCGGLLKEFFFSLRNSSNN
jgi:tRNA(adenine34) deaminase